MKNFENLMQEFNDNNFKINNKKKEKNIFEVMKQPHYENVVSNILSFFFDIKEEHGFADLYIKALLLAYDKKNNTNYSERNIHEANVEREYSGGENKRIDLLIECNNFIIVIENKIYASLDNDLIKYTEIARNYRNDKEVIEIVLSTFPVKKEKLLNTKYINILYEDLFDFMAKIEKDYVIDGKWKIFHEEFRTNIKNIKGEMNMDFDNNWIDFINNKKEFSSLIEKYEEETKKRERFLIKVKSILTENEFPFHNVYLSEKADYVSHHIEINLNDGTNVVIETCMNKFSKNKEFGSYDSLYIFLWARNNKKYDFSEIINKIGGKIENMRYSNSNDTFSFWGNHYLLEEISLLEEGLLNTVVDKLIGYVSKIK